MRHLAVLVLCLAAFLPASGAPAAPEALTPTPAYYRPVVADGMAFPVARSNWFSVIEFEDGWHDPRFRLVDGRWRLVGVHEGVDIVAEEGTAIVSMAPGSVEQVGWTFYSGTRVGVRGIDGRYYFYAHLSAIAPGITPGARVEAGSILGRVGNTGYGPPGHRDEFPPHLHLGIQEASGWVNPYPEVERLYEASARRTAAGERRLSLVAAAGDRETFERIAANLYATPSE